MSDRETELRRLTADIRDHEAIDDAFLAKSFTDRLVIIDVSDSDAVPAEVRSRLAEYDVHTAEREYGGGGNGSSAGNVGDATRHHFIDVQTRGSH